MGGHGMMGHGMMGGWYGPTWRMGAGMGCPMMGGYPYYPYYWKPSLGPVTIEEAVNIAERYLASLGIQDLAIEEIQEYTWNFYVLYYEKNTGIGAFEMLIDKYSGAIYPEPGPNMMWNTKYGMMGSYWVQPLEMPIISDQALKIAQSYLDAYLPGAVADHVHTFYGYYTIMVSVGGEPYGMLSVNGYNGQVWYHTWHGSFIQELEFK
jgi:hypothetical protein